MHLRRTLFGLMALSVAACSDEKPSTTQVQFCDQFAHALCKEVSSACLFPMNGCIAKRANECLTEASANATLGQTFVAAKADLCLAKVTEIYSKLNKGAVALRSADWDAVNATCKQVYQGNRTLNEPCLVDADCLEDYRCDKGRCGISVVKGPGAGCANIGEHCTEGYYCGPSLEILACIPKVGATLACSGDVPCFETLRCFDGRCQVRLPIGEQCLFHQDCAGHFCEPYAAKCANDIRFANGSAACLALQ